MGVSETLKKHNQAIQIIGVQPEDGAKIAGIRRWPKAYLPKIFDATKVDTIMDVSQTAREIAIASVANDSHNHRIVHLLRQLNSSRHGTSRRYASKNTFFCGQIQDTKMRNLAIGVLPYFLCTYQHHCTRNMARHQWRGYAFCLGYGDDWHD
jgi:hypothetical protein